MAFLMFGGFSLANKMADEFGIERKLYKTALTEVGVNFSHFKIQKAELIKDGANEIIAMQILVSMYLQELMDGIAILDRKFPHMEEIVEAIAAARKYVDEGPYKDIYKHYCNKS